jgi:hypothetical protein
MLIYPEIPGYRENPSPSTEQIIAQPMPPEVFCAMYLYANIIVIKIQVNARGYRNASSYWQELR